MPKPWAVTWMAGSNVYGPRWKACALPPGPSWRSRTSTDLPALARQRPADSPPRPAPTTIASSESAATGRLPLAQADLVVQLSQRRRGPPVAVAEQRHQRGHQEGPDDRRIDDHRQRGPDAHFLDEDDRGGCERADRDAEEQGRLGDDASRALEPDRHRFRVVVPGYAGLLDPGEQEDGVVRRQPERHREQEHRLRE